MRYILLSLLLSFPIWGQEERIPWDQSPQMLSGRLAKLELTNGLRLEGSWIRVTPTNVEMRVEKSSDEKRIGLGVALVERGEIRNAKARYRRVRRRVWGTIIGFYVAAGIAGERAQGYGAFPVFGVAGLGYVLGKSFDESTKTLSFY
jgi:hypothetical protein